jgi:hypothetical protein
MRAPHLAVALFAISGAMYVNAQTMYKCGTTYSQTPCGTGQKEIDVKTDDPCENEANKYSSACIMRPYKPSKPSAAETKRRAESEAIDKERDQVVARGRQARAEAEKKEADLVFTQAMDKVRKNAEKRAAVVPETLPSKETIAKSKALCIKTAMDKLKDPESARVTEVQRIGARNIELVGGAWAVRILYQMNINAKNSYGGYEGKKLWQCDYTQGETELKGAYQME